jgi:2-polyprenyl-3-methyl-5-hydroxy-6-metoxy-1,4-benzoquinol methylase
VNFSTRSYEKELLDRDDIPFEDIRINMHELDIINKRLGGHQINIRAVESLLYGHSTQQAIIIAEIGCGGGDNLRALYNWSKKNDINASFIGIDINAHCISYASSNNEIPGARWVVSDYREMNFNEKPSIIFSSLFCHHFTDDQIADMLGWMKSNATLGFFINDLHRHWLAYHSIRLITSAFSSSYLVKNDAPLSVRRGFSRKDWKKLIEASGLTRYSIQWKWAFRWLIVVN